MSTETIEPNPTDGLHNALVMATGGLLALTEFVEGRLTEAQINEIVIGLADGTRRLALFLSRSNDQVHVEIALIDATMQTVFKNAIGRFDAPFNALFADAERVSLVDRGRLN